MERNSTQTTTVLAAVLAALLSVTPPAAAAKTKKHQPKVDPVAAKLMSEGLGDLQRGEYTAAISVFNKAVRSQRGVSTYFLLGWAHYQRGFKHGAVETADRDDAQSAIDAYQLAIETDPTLAELPDASRLHFSMALCQEAVGSYDAALESYKRALKAAPNKALIPLHAARLRLKMKDEDKAMSNLEMALSKARKNGHEGALIAAVKRDPSFAPLIENPMTRRALGVSKAEAAASADLVASNFDVRGDEMRDAVRDTPARPAPAAQDPAVVEKIASGDLEFKFRRYQNAVTAYNEALAIDQEKTTLSKDKVAALYEKIGTAYNKIGSSEQAVRSLQKSLQMNPMNAGAYYQVALGYAMAGKTTAALHALKETFSSCSNPTELRRLVLLSKTDVELEAVRDLPGYSQTMAEVADRVALR
ncbi:MAG: tetratricopeptide repeat protein [Elusimicrobia bacterium]|nr:tetratricopeptide repeat protein [Elusimicrobiota bacterium]